MKKTLTAAALSSVLVLGLASSALAIHETETAEQPVVATGATKITLDGDVRVRGMYDKDDWTEDAIGRSGYDTRVQLGVKAQVSPEASAYVKLESGTDNTDLYTWGHEANTDALFTGGQKAGSLSILEAWINYSPSADWGAKVGHMPLALGNKVFFDHTKFGDDAIVFYGNLGEATHVAALTIKFDEGRNGAFLSGNAAPDSTDDLDGYVALITSKVNDALNLGANYTYLRGGSTATVDFGNENFPGLSLSNVGLTADGKVGAISYMADAEFQFGDVASVDDVLNLDAGGWAMKLGADYDLGAGKIGITFGHGSGDDQKDTLKDLSNSRVLGVLSGGALGGNKKNLNHDGFISFLSDTNYDTIIAGYRSPIPGAASWTQSLAGLPKGYAAANQTGRDTGLSNLNLYQLHGSTKVVCPLTGKDLSLYSSVSYMTLAEDTINGLKNNGELNKANTVGTELDLVATWQLSAGLNYKVEAAYLWTGDVYDTPMPAGFKDLSADNLAFIRHSLEVKF